MRRLAPALLALLVGLAYSNTLDVPFILDDEEAVVRNPWLGRPSPPRSVLTGRPVLAASLALNHAAGGLDVRGYHAVNLGIHILAAWALLALARKSLDGAAAFALAALWALHPLHTEAVTYVAQRAESLAGLLYLTTILGVATGRPVLAVSASALGMGVKEVMATAPLMALLYDRTFLSGSFREAFRKRGRLHLSLLATWAVLGACLWTRPEASWVGPSEVSPWRYALTQAGVLLLYLRLAFWPDALVLDYAWPLGGGWGEAALLLSLVALTGWALWRRPVPGFLGAWFFGILAPTSSVVPLLDAAAERRMYLPLAALAALVVTALGRLGRPAWALWIAIGLALGARTFVRNEDYRSRLSIWTATVAQRPQNPRARWQLGDALHEAGDLAGAVRELTEAVRLMPDSAICHYELGRVLSEAGDPSGALAHLERALALQPEFPEARFALDYLKTELARR